MEVPLVGTQYLKRHFEGQMRAQEQQLVRVRLAVVVLVTLYLLSFGQHIDGRWLLIAVMGLMAAYSLVVPFLLARLPAFPVSIGATVLDMLTVSAAVWVATDVPDAYLFYGLVILGTALRFGLMASIASSLVIAAMYLVVVLVGEQADATVRELLSIRLLYLVSFGVVAGLFSRIVVGRADENARLQQRLAAEEQERVRGRDREILARLGRDFGASLDLGQTLHAIVSGTSPLLGDASMVFTPDPDQRRLLAAAGDGADPGLAARWREYAERHPPQLGEGIVGSVAATVTLRLVHSRDVEPGDPDGLHELGIDWLLAAPIVAAGRLHGVLATVGLVGRAVDDRTRRMAEALADRAGPALQNAHLWSDLQERMAREEQARRVKDDFLSVVSHELRTPLTSIQGYSQLLERRLGAERGVDKELAHLRVIGSQVQRMRRLVDDLLDVSRIDRRGGVSIEPVDFDLAEELRETVKRVRREQPERTVDLDAPETVPVHLDRDRVDQVLTNLLENAVKYSPEGGPIGVVCLARDNEVEVRISDTGIGVSAEHRDNVFERFYQAGGEPGRRRFGGLGLGLAISRAIVDAHGGRIWVEPNADAGRGSVFAFRLPRTAAATRSSEYVDAGEAPDFVLRSKGR